MPAAIPITVPRGSDGQLQYNNGGVFGGASGLYWDEANSRLGGSQASGGHLRLVSTEHATKGKVYFGAAETSYYDEVADALLLGGIVQGANLKTAAAETGGDDCTFVGESAALSNSGTRNTAIGKQAMNSVTSGTSNFAAGFQAMYSLTTGGNNFALGYASLFSVTATSFNVAVGSIALMSCTGNQNVAVGSYAGAAITADDAGVFLGYSAGRYETAAGKLFIDNQDRSNEAGDRSKALIYGVFAAAPADQELYLNVGLLKIGGSVAGLEKSADPAEPAEGEFVIWMSDSTGKGADGDVLIASKAGGVTKYATLFDHSAGAGW